MNFKNSLVLLVLVSISLLGFASAVDLACGNDINSDYFGGTLHPTGADAGWSGACFTLTESDDANTITIDCAGDTVLSDATSTSFLNMDSNTVGTINLLNCNFTIGVADSSFVFVNFADSTHQNTMDINFSGSYLDLNVGDGFLFNSVDIDTLNIYDLNVLSKSSLLGALDFNTGVIDLLKVQDSYFDLQGPGGFSIPVGIYLGYGVDINFVNTQFYTTASYGVLLNGDANEINIYNADVTVNGGPNAGIAIMAYAPGFTRFTADVNYVNLYNYDFNSLETSANSKPSAVSIAFANQTNTLNISFDSASSFDVNQGRFIDVTASTLGNLVINGNSMILNPNYELISVSSMNMGSPMPSTIGDINFSRFGVASSWNSLESVLSASGTDGVSITNFYLFDNNMAFNGDLVNLDDANITNILVYNNYFYDLSSGNDKITTDSNSYLLGNVDFNIPQTLATNIIGGSYKGGNYWVNWSNSTDADKCVENDGNGFCLTNDKNVTADINGIPTVYTDYLPLTDLALGLTTDLSATSIDSNISYHYVGDYIDLNFVYSNAGISEITTDYNLIYTIDLTALGYGWYELCNKYITASIAASATDYNVCTTQIGTSITPGDYNIRGEVFVSGDENSDNNYALHQYTIYGVDLNAQSIDLNLTTVVYGDSLDINFIYMNSSTGDANSDMNILFYIEDVLYSTSVVSEDLISGATTSTDYAWDVNLTGTVDINVCADYSSYDVNSTNDCYQESITVYYRDLDVNTSSIQVSSTTPTYTDTNMDINVYIYNLGDYNSEDFNVTLYAIEDANTNNIVTIHTWTLQDVNASSYTRLNTYWLPSIDGNVDLNIVATPLQDDYNSTNHTILFDRYLNVKHVDLKGTTIDFNDSYVMYGEAVDINFTILNNGTATADLNYDVNFYIENVLIGSNRVTSDLSANATLISDYVWTATSTETLDVNVCAFYSGTDFNVVNDCNTTTLVVHYRDLDVNTSSIQVSSTTPTYTDTNMDINVYVYNLGDYNSEDFNAVLYAIEDTNANNIVTIHTWTLQDVNANSYVRLNTNWQPTIDANVDLNIVVTPLQTDYNSTNHTILFDRYLNVKHVDLNVSTVVADVNAGHSGDINCVVTNIGTANATGNYNVFMYIDGELTDYNTQTSTLNASSSLVYQYSWTLTAKQNDRNIGCVVDYYGGTDYNTSNDEHYVDKNVGADSLVDLSVVDIRVDSTVAGTTATAYCDINNLSTDANATADYNVLFYVDDELTDSSDETTDILTEEQATVSFSWAPTAGTYTLRCDVDYNVTNYTKFDANLDNNTYSESTTITSVSTGGSGSSIVSVTVNEEVPKVVTISENARVEFKYAGSTHSVKLSNVDALAGTAEIIIASTPMTYILKVGESAKRDLDADGTYDVQVTLDSITSSSKATFSILQISERIPTTVIDTPTQTRDTTQTTGTSSNTNTGQTSQGTSSEETGSQETIEDQVVNETPETETNDVPIINTGAEAKSVQWGWIVGVLVLVLIVVGLYLSFPKSGHPGKRDEELQKWKLSSEKKFSENTPLSVGKPFKK